MGVSVEDEWDRNPDAEVTDDLLFIRYDADKITADELLECIRRAGFEGEIQ